MKTTKSGRADARCVEHRALPPWVLDALSQAESGQKLNPRSRAMLVTRGLALPSTYPDQHRTLLTPLGHETLQREFSAGRVRVRAARARASKESLARHKSRDGKAA